MNEADLSQYIVERLPTAVGVVDKQGTFVFANSALAMLSGYDIAQITGLDIRCLDGLSRPQLSNSLIAVEAKSCWVTQLRRADGVLQGIICSCQPIDWQGQAYQLLLLQQDDSGLGIDNNGARTGQGFCEREAHYRHLVEMLTDAVLVITDGKICFANRMALTMFAASGGTQMLGKSFADLLVVDESPAYRALRSWLFTQPQQGDRQVSFEVPMVACDGRQFLAALHLARIAHDGEAAIQVLCHDISEQKREYEYTLGHRHILEKIVDQNVGIHEVLDQIVALSEHCVPDVIASILLLDESGERLFHVASCGLPADYIAAIDGSRIGPNAGSCGTATYRKERVIVADIATDPLWQDYRDVALSHGLKTCWSYPILDSQENILGALAFYFSCSQSPNGWALHANEGLAHLTATAIVHKRTLTSMRHFESRLSEAQAIAHIGSWEHEIASDRLWWSDEVYRIFALDKNDTRIECYEDFVTRIHPDDREKVDLAYRHSLIKQEGYVVTHRLLLPSNEIRYVEERCRTDYDEQGLPVRSMGTVQDISATYLAEERLSRMSYFDELTGQPNRRLLLDRLAQGIELSARTGRPLSLLYFDLDRFKLINDTLGHSVGDQVLKTIAMRVSDVLRSADTLARMGGDEFSVLLPEISFDNALLVAKKIVRAVAQTISIADQDLVIAASVGIVDYPVDGKDAETLLRHADIAMYRAKASSQSICLFSGEMGSQMALRLNLEQDLARALENDELSLAFQGQFVITPACSEALANGAIDAFPGAVMGCEALLRWQHPLRGWVSPAEFIPLAEEIGLIHQITQWVIKNVCEQAMIWEKMGIRPRRIAINLSAVQLIHRGLAGDILEWITATGAYPSWFEIEVTESAAMHNTDIAGEIIRDLTVAGLSIAIDDFGTGYSSLAYLKRLPASTIKIDRSFVQGLPHDADDIAIVRSTIAMAHALGKAVTAEGIENVDQYAFLCAEGCDYGQGFLLSRPSDATACSLLLQQTLAADGASAGGLSG